MEKKKVESAIRFFDSLSVTNTETKIRTSVVRKSVIQCGQLSKQQRELERNIQKPPDLLLPPDLEAKQILENFEKEVSPYNTFTIGKDVTANDVFKPTFQMFPEVRESFKRIAGEVKNYMKPMRYGRRVIQR